VVGNWRAHLNGEWVRKLQQKDVPSCAVGRICSQRSHAGNARSVLLILICVACVLACMVRVKGLKVKVRI